MAVVDSAYASSGLQLHPSLNEAWQKHRQNGVTEDSKFHHSLTTIKVTLRQVLKGSEKIQHSLCTRAAQSTADIVMVQSSEDGLSMCQQRACKYIPVPAAVAQVIVHNIVLTSSTIKKSQGNTSQALVKPTTFKPTQRDNFFISISQVLEGSEITQHNLSTGLSIVCLRVELRQTQYTIIEQQLTSQSTKYQRSQRTLQHNLQSISSSEAVWVIATSQAK